MNTHALLSRTSISITLVALGALAGCQSSKASPQHDEHAQSGAMRSSSAGATTMPAAMSKPSSMMAGCQAMQEKKRKMAEEMRVQDVALAARVAEMNGAPESDQLRLLAAIVTQMTEQRAAMHETKAAMEENMLKHMLQHMEAGKDSMTQCPMMAGMKNTNDK